MPPAILDQKSIGMIWRADPSIEWHAPSLARFQLLCSTRGSQWNHGPLIQGTQQTDARLHHPSTASQHVPARPVRLLRLPLHELLSSNPPFGFAPARVFKSNYLYPLWRTPSLGICFKLCDNKRWDQDLARQRQQMHRSGFTKMEERPCVTNNDPGHFFLPFCLTAQLISSR
jgi:hypothetical protein